MFTKLDSTNCPADSLSQSRPFILITTQYMTFLAELGGLFELLGVTKCEEEIRQIITTFDDDESGEIGITEFIILMNKQVQRVID